MRTLCVTQKVATAFGACYAHLQLDDKGLPCGLSFSSPGKCDNTQLDEVIRRLAGAADDLIKDALK